MAIVVVMDNNGNDDYRNGYDTNILIMTATTTNLYVNTVRLD